MPRIIYCFYLFAATWSVAYGQMEGQPHDCAKIKDNLERLACFDSLKGTANQDEAPGTTDNTDRNSTNQELPEAAENAEIAVARRDEEIERISRARFAIAPYRTNYILPLAYNDTSNQTPFDALIPEEDRDKAEAKYQISFQFDIRRNLFKKNYDLYFAYTQLAFWQVYNTSASSPFRETNYEPEIAFRFYPSFKLMEANMRKIHVGLVHQSNGRGEPLSRSWNRIFAMFFLDKGNFATVVRPWYRIPEDEDDDDNPDIDEFLGDFEWHIFYKWNMHTYGLMLRNNLDNDANRGALQLDLSYPLTDRLKLYLQYFNGYGESLIDYNRYTNRIGIGIMLTDWL